MRRMGILASAVVAMMVFVGCKDDVVSQGTSRNPDGTVAISEGTVGAHADKKNLVITDANKDSVLSTLAGVLSMTEARARATVKYDTSYTMAGANSGEMKMVASASMDDQTGKGSGTIKLIAFDYSDDGEIFLGGALTSAFTMSETAMNMSYNGAMNFAGEYKGQIIYSLNMVVSMTDETAEPKITGKVELVSGGKTYDLTSEVMTAMNEEEEVVEEDNTIVVNQ